MSEQLDAFALQMREGLLAVSVAIGLDVMGELVDAEVTDLAGRKGKDDSEPRRLPARHRGLQGHPGGRIPGRRPWVRTVADDDRVERKVHLESYGTFASVELLADHMVTSMLAGLSGRRYHRAVERVGETVEATASGSSQSSVLRRFVTATAECPAPYAARQRCELSAVRSDAAAGFEDHTICPAIKSTVWWM